MTSPAFIPSVCRFFRWTAVAIFTSLGCLGLTSGARADTITFTGSSDGLAASAIFTVTGNTLSLTLTNTASAAVGVPANVLTAVFFDTNSVPLTATSASISSGSLTMFTGGSTITNPLTNVGHEWAANSLGVGAAGFSVFGAGDVIDPSGTLFSDLTPSGTSGTPPDGLAGGLIPASGFSSPNGGLQNRWVINNSINFTFSFDGTLSATDFSNVKFQYGTSLSEPSFPGKATLPPPPAVPAPPALLLAAIGVGCTMFGSVRRRLVKA